jgi:hypothetical protein
MPEYVATRGKTLLAGDFHSQCQENQKSLALSPYKNIYHQKTVQQQRK